MPSTPRIPKEVILEHALQILIEDGYAALNIKALASKIGCSTQPISWHFGNMEGLRKELAAYALHYAKEKLKPSQKGMEGFASVGKAYVNLAFDSPNLFCYLYMSCDSGNFIDGLHMFTSKKENADMVEQIVEQLGVERKKAESFCNHMITYTHGLASYVASGLLKATRKEVYEMIYQGSIAFLQQLGVDAHTAGREWMALES